MSRETPDDPHAPAGLATWRRLHERLAVIQARVDEALQIQPATHQALLDARARQVAARRPPTLEHVARLDVVVARRAHLTLAFETETVLALDRFDRRVPLSPVPGTPTRVMGATLFEGAVLPVFDLHTSTASATTSQDVLPWLLILGTPSHPPLGVALDAVEAVESWPRHDLSPIDAAHAPVPWVRAITYERGILVVDSDMLLSHTDTYCTE